MAGLAFGAAPIKAAAKQKLAPPAPAKPAHPALKAAAKRATGAYSGALNSLSDQEQRVHDVARRRQADAKAYSAFVMGQQGAIAAASQAQDQKALGNTVGVQALTLAAQSKLQSGLGAQRAASGAAGPVPAQQQSGLAGDASRTQALLGAVSQSVADRGNTNAAKAGFLATAAQQGLAANKRAIAGDEYNQASDIRREKTAVLSNRTQAAIADRQARAQNGATKAAAQLQADSAAAALRSREDIAGANIAARAAQGHKSRVAAATQGAKNRRVRLKTAATTAAAGGYATPAEHRRRNKELSDNSADITEGVAFLKRNKVSAADARDMLASSKLGSPLAKTTPPEVVDYILAATYKGKAPGTVHKNKRGKVTSTGTSRYKALTRKIKSGAL